VSRRLRTVALELVDEPFDPIRARFDEAELDELAESIKALGLIEPIVVEATGPRFRVIAGHRRLLACRRAGVTHVDIVVRGDAAETGDAVMLHENIARDDLSPAEEARLFERVYLALGEDIEAAAKKLKVTVGYIDARLALLRGDPEILAALDAGEISIGVAEELNQVQLDDYRKTFLHDATITGCTIRQAREWRLRANAQADLQAIAAARGDSPSPSPSSPPPSVKPTLDCEFCESGQFLDQLRLVHMHASCIHAMRALLRRTKGDT
jgi:ParB/RepB/Spo0J family partition protein